MSNTSIYKKIYSRYKDGGLSGSVLARMIYINKDPGVMINNSLTEKDEIPKNSPIPPQTPHNDLSIDNFIKGLLFKLPLLVVYILP